MSMKTPEEVEELKKQWRHDPIWDIEDTEGFEAHRQELLEFHEEYRKDRDRRYSEYLEKEAERIGTVGNIKLTEKVLSLENRIETLYQKLLES